MSTLDLNEAYYMLDMYCHNFSTLEKIFNCLIHYDDFDGIVKYNTKFLKYHSQYTEGIIHTIVNMDETKFNWFIICRENIYA